MTFSIQKLLAASALLAVASTASATVLDFEGLTKPGNPGAVRDFFQAPYNGMTFGVIPTANPAYKLGGSWFWSRDISGLSNSPTTSASTEYPVDANGIPIVGPADQQSEKITSTGGTFTFAGASFKGLDLGIDVRFHLYLNGTDIWQSAFAPLADCSGPAPTPPTCTSVFLASGYGGLVDAVTVEGYQGYFAMDDFNFTAVPEPESFGLVALAMGGLVATTRRRRPVVAA